MLQPNKVGMSGIKRLKRARVDVEIEVVSKYFKKEPSEITLRPLEHVEKVDARTVKAMGAKDFFTFIEDKTSDDLSKPLKIYDDELLPDNFLSIYSKVRFMRSKIVTPVDTVGCAMMPITINEKFGIKKYEILPRNYRLQLLVALMMSSQTKDETNAKAMYNLMEYFIETMKIKEGLTLEALMEIDDVTLGSLIRIVGFHKKKTIYIKKAAQMLTEQFDGDVPISIEGFVSLPGVGPKMGYLALQKSWGIVGGIGVDVHVDRLSKMWKWVDVKKCKTPEHTRKALESWLPHDLWYEINPVLVGFGQVICPARGRRCDLCLANSLCPNVDKKLVKTASFNVDEVSKRGDYKELLTHLQKERG